MGYTVRRARDTARAGRPGPEGSGLKLRGSKLFRDYSALASRILGPEMAIDPHGELQTILLTAPSLSIRGGTDEIQRNIVGERVLGLPEEPRVDRALPFDQLPRRFLGKVGGMGAFSEAGWYDVPDSSDQRYWNGEEWTESYRPRPQRSADGLSPPERTPTSGLAIASLVLGIASFFVSCLGIVTGVVGVVLGLSALRECRPRGPKNGRGLAIAGIICSTVAFFLMFVLTFFFLLVLRAA